MKKNKPSSTALFVSNGLWWVANHPGLSIEIPERMRTLNHEMMKYLNLGIFSTQNRFGRCLLKFKTSLMQKFAMPGFYLHFALRKRCIDDHVGTAIREGAEQIIVIGSGFDTLSLRISQDFPNLKIIEIDHPATQKSKSKAIYRFDEAFKNLHLLPHDFTECSIHELLLQSEHYDSSKSSVFVAEGLLMYLDEKEVRGILDGIRLHSSSDSRFIFTYMEVFNEGDFQFKCASPMTLYWLKMKREMFTWGLKTDQLVSFLDHSGFDVLVCKTHKELREEYLTENNLDASLVVGENIVVATISQ